MTDKNLDKVPGGSVKGRQRGNAEKTRTAVALVLGALLAVFAVLNTGKVEVDWILGTAQTPLIIVIAVNLALGFAVGYLLARRGARTRQRKK